MGNVHQQTLNLLIQTLSIHQILQILSLILYTTFSFPAQNIPDFFCNILSEKSCFKFFIFLSALLCQFPGFFIVHRGINISDFTFALNKACYDILWIEKISFDFKPIFRPAETARIKKLCSIFDSYFCTWLFQRTWMKSRPKGGPNIQKFRLFNLNYIYIFVWIIFG